MEEQRQRDGTGRWSRLRHRVTSTWAVVAAVAVVIGAAENDTCGRGPFGDTGGLLPRFSVS